MNKITVDDFDAADGALTFTLENFASQNVVKQS
jgi:hypothetical protein